MSHQHVADLVELTGYPFPVYVSPGVEPRAHMLAIRCQRGQRFLTTTLQIDVAACLLVLAPAHWEAHTGSPMFGIPQTVDPRTVVVAGEHSELWDMIIPPAESLPPTLAERMQAIYGQPDGTLRIDSYMDLLPIHELGHLFIDQRAGQFDFHQPRRWIIELFCNLCLHVYTAIEEPDQLPTLETLPQAIVAAGEGLHPHTALSDFESIYADMNPPNFVWYLSRLHIAAQQLYDTAGSDLLVRLYRMIGSPHEVPTDHELEAILSREVGSPVAELLRQWDA